MCLTLADFKTCPRCHKTKPVSDFGMRSGRQAKYVRSQCRVCVATYNREKRRALSRTDRDALNERYRAYRQSHPDVFRAIHLRKRGSSPEAYAAQLAAQDGVCAICGQSSRLVLDHDHSTGQQRGLLCSACNTGLGLFADDPSRLLAAAAYLERGRLASA